MAATLAAAASVRSRGFLLVRTAVMAMAQTASSSPFRARSSSEEVSSSAARRIRSTWSARDRVSAIAGRRCFRLTSSGLGRDTFRNWFGARTSLLRSRALGGLT